MLKIKDNSTHIKNVISQRLKLNTNQRILDSSFNIKFASLNKIINPVFLRTQFVNWEREKKNQFYIVVGGRANFRETELFFNNLL